MTCAATHNATSSPASADGLSPWLWQDGRLIARYGQDRALVSLSASQAREWGLLTSGISGPHGSTSSASASLQSSLASRLRQRLDMRGSMECVPTWKDKATPSGRPYCQLVPQARRTDVTDSGSERRRNATYAAISISIWQEWRQRRSGRHRPAWRQRRMATTRLGTARALSRSVGTPWLDCRTRRQSPAH